MYFEISGIIKARWSDFQVRVISKTGEIARLSRFDLPEVKILNKKKQYFQVQIFKFQAIKPSFWSILAEKPEPLEDIDVSVISSENKEKLGKLSKTGEKGEKFEIDGSSDKAERTAMDEVVITMPGFDVQYSKVIESELEPILAKVQDHDLNGLAITCINVTSDKFFYIKQTQIKI